MDGGGGVIAWFEGYLSVFEACGRGDEEARALLDPYNVPLLLSTDDGFVALADEGQVVGAAERQVEGLRAAGYGRSEMLDSDVAVLNAVSALFHGRFARLRSDESEIGRLEATYLIADGPLGRRIAALAIHSP